MVSVTDPYGRILGFLDRSRYFCINISSVVLTRLSRPRSRPTTFFSGSAGNRIRASGSVAKNLTTGPQRRSIIKHITIHNYYSTQSLITDVLSVHK
jgi:hypothetical protein